VVVEHDGDGVASVVSGGDLEVGSETRLGNVYTGAGLQVGRYALVDGVAIAGAGIDADVRANISGEQLPTGYVRPHDIAWVRGFDDAAGRSVTVEAGEYVELQPGSYDRIIVEPGGSLQLSPGAYEAESLVVGERGTVIVTGDDVSLYVQSGLELYGVVMAGFAEDMGRFLLAYFGSADAILQAPFEGRVIAPNSRVTLGSGRETTFAGAIMARELEVLPNTVITYTVP
jgi:hypothetical protein